MTSASRRLAVLVRLLRGDLAAADKDSAPLRVIVFANSASEVKAVADPLIGALWTEHKISVLLPPGACGAAWRGVVWHGLAYALCCGGGRWSHLAAGSVVSCWVCMMWIGV